MKPTIGRTVLFHPTAGVTQAAVVAYVHSDTMVNLAVFDSNGVASGATSVQLVQPGQPKPEFGLFCEWPSFHVGALPPFQVELAEKADTPVAFVMQKKTAEALERIIQKVDEQIQISG